MIRLLLPLLCVILLCAPDTAWAGDKALVKQISFFTAVTGTLSILILMTLMLTAIAIYAGSFMPARIESVRRAQRRYPLGALGIGVLNIGFMVILTGVAAEAGGGAALLPGIALLGMLLIGMMSKGLDIGHRVLAASGYTPTPIWSFTAGIPIVVTLSAVPLIGWLLIWPGFASAGFGGALLSFFVGTGDLSAPETSPTC